MKSLLILFDNIVTIYIWILIINAVLSWLVAFSVLNTSNRFVYSILDVSYRLTAPPLNFIRKFPATIFFLWTPEFFDAFITLMDFDLQNSKRAFFHCRF